MKINMERMENTMRTLIETPSVVGYYPAIHTLLEDMAKSLGCQLYFDNRSTAYIQLEGQHPERTICLGAHLDTIGLVVRGVDDNGWLRVRQLGGVNYHSLENENVYIHTRHNGTYTGMVIHEKHSVHVFEDARESERTENTMRILLDADVHNAKDVYALGIGHGDLVSVEPRYQKCESGYIKSRHIDDKACAAALLECIAVLKENNLQPMYNTVFAFPIYEEIGLGGGYVPEGIDTYIALDIGLVGPDYEGSEKKVSICAADRHCPYDWKLTTALVDLAKNAGIAYGLDSFFRYGSDASAAMSAGQNIRHALFGPGCMNSHSYERTHIEGLKACVQLAMEILLSDTI